VEVEMYLNKNKTKEGRIHLSILDNYWDPIQKRSRKRVVEKIGYLDVIEKTIDDPIAFYEKRCQELNRLRDEGKSDLDFKFDPNERISVDDQNKKNYGHLAISSIYHSLGLDAFLKKCQRPTMQEFDANTIMKILIFSRAIFPGSKLSDFNNRSAFFEKTNYSLSDLYNCLDVFEKNKDKMLNHLNESVKNTYGRDTSYVYYDVTNYYFEIDKNDDLRLKGYSKENRPNPIVQLGLFMDNNGLPVCYELFPGNNNDCTTYIPNFTQMRRNYGLGRVIVVADKGMTTGDNIWFTKTTAQKDGYVFAYSVRGADKETKEYVLNQEGYTWIGDDYKRKSRPYPRKIHVTHTNGKKKDKVVDEKQVVFYSRKYDIRSKAKRNASLEKAKDLIKNPSKYNKASSFGAAGYIKGIDFDKNTGEILTLSKMLELDEEKIAEEEALDGYYMIITSEMDESDDRIIEIYRGLWKIEETFKVTKTGIESRPVYVWTKEHIRAHFLICFVTLLILRILEKQLNNKYSAFAILESLRKSECIHMQRNYYLFSYTDEILTKLGKALDIDFSKKLQTLGNIKKSLARTKKK